MKKPQSLWLPWLILGSELYAGETTLQAHAPRLSLASMKQVAAASQWTLGGLFLGGSSAVLQPFFGLHGNVEAIDFPLRAVNEAGVVEAQGGAGCLGGLQWKLLQRGSGEGCRFSVALGGAYRGLTPYYDASAEGSLFRKAWRRTRSPISGVYGLGSLRLQAFKDHLDFKIEGSLGNLSLQERALAGLVAGTLTLFKVVSFRLMAHKNEKTNSPVAFFLEVDPVARWLKGVDMGLRFMLDAEAQWAPTLIFKGLWKSEGARSFDFLEHCLQNERVAFAQGFFSKGIKGDSAPPVPLTSPVEKATVLTEVSQPQPPTIIDLSSAHSPKSSASSIGSELNLFSN